ARETRMNPTLKAHLRGTGLRRFDRAPRNLFKIEIVRRSPQIGRSTTFGERAEAAVIEADVGVVDIPIDDVGHRLAHRLLAELIGGGNDFVEVPSFSAEEPYDVILAQRVTRASRRQNGAGLRRAVFSRPASRDGR